MRLDQIRLFRGIIDPSSGTSALRDRYDSSEGPVSFDLYMVGEALYIVRNNKVAVVLPHGVAYIGGEAGEKKAEELLKRFPRPVKPELTSNR